MPGQPGSENRQRQHVMQVRMTDAEFQYLDQLATDAGVTRAEVVRRAVAGTKVLTANVAQIERQLLAVGNNLNQLARTANIHGERVADEVEGWGDEIRGALWRLNGVLDEIVLT